MKEETLLSDEEIQNFLMCDDDQNILIYTGEFELDDFRKNTIFEIIEKIHLNGPLCSEKLTTNNEQRVSNEQLTTNNEQLFCPSPNLQEQAR